MMNLDYPLNSMWMASLQRHMTFVLPWENIRMLPKGIRCISFIPLPRVGEAGNIGDVVHELRDEVALLVEALLQMDTYSKCPFALCDAADHHLNDLYHWSTDKVAQYLKIRCAIGSKLEWL